MSWTWPRSCAGAVMTCGCWRRRRPMSSCPSGSPAPAIRSPSPTTARLPASTSAPRWRVGPVVGWRPTTSTCFTFTNRSRPASACSPSKRLPVLWWAPSTPPWTALWPASCSRPPRYRSWSGSARASLCPRRRAALSSSTTAATPLSSPTGSTSPPSRRPLRTIRVSPARPRHPRFRSWDAWMSLERDCRCWRRPSPPSWSAFPEPAS